MSKYLTFTDVVFKNEALLVAALSKGAGEWRGSINQRIIYEPSTFKSCVVARE